jgi:hypothetical protein
MMILDFIIWEAELATPALFACAAGCLLIVILMVLVFVAVACALITGCLEWVAGGGSHGNPQPEQQPDPEHADEVHPSTQPEPQPGDGGDEGEGKQGSRTCNDPPADDGLLRHYTTEEGRIGIQSRGQIRVGGTGRIFLTPTVYSSAGTALSELAMPSTPAGYFEIPRDRLGNLDGLQLSD